MKRGLIQDGQTRVTLSRQDKGSWAVYRNGVREKGVSTEEALVMAEELLSDVNSLHKIMIEID